MSKNILPVGQGRKKILSDVRERKVGWIPQYCSLDRKYQPLSHRCGAGIHCIDVLVTSRMVQWIASKYYFPGMWHILHYAFFFMNEYMSESFSCLPLPGNIYFLINDPITSYIVCEGDTQQECRGSQQEWWRQARKDEDERREKRTLHDSKNILEQFCKSSSLFLHIKLNGIID